MQIELLLGHKSTVALEAGPVGYEPVHSAQVLAAVLSATLPPPHCHSPKLSLLHMLSVPATASRAEQLSDCQTDRVSDDVLFKPMAWCRSEP